MKHNNYKKLIVLSLLLLFSLSCVQTSAASEKLKVHFINVTYGDSMLLTCGGEAMVVDFGRKDMGPVVSEYLRKQNISTIKYAVATHPHHDHMSGMLDVLENFDIKNVMMTPRNPLNEPYLHHQAYLDIMDTIQSYHINTILPYPGDIYYLGKAKIEFLAPLKTYNGANNSSLVMKVKYGKTSFILTGDAEKASEKAMINRYGNKLKADVLKLGHHGKSKSTSKAFLKTVKPKWAVISCGPGATETGKPSRSLLNTLKKYNIKVYRTDTYNNIIASSNGKKIKWKSN